MPASKNTATDLFAPIRLGALTLPNRMVLAPLTRNRAGAGNVPQALNANYYEQRASAGLIITEASQISPQGVGYPATPGIHSEAQVAGWKQVTETVHKQGGRLFLQLWHVGQHHRVEGAGDLNKVRTAARLFAQLAEVKPDHAVPPSPGMKVTPVDVQVMRQLTLGGHAIETHGHEPFC